MSAGTDLIFFNNPEDWQTIVNTSRRAQVINENSHTPIPGFDLGVSLNKEYIAAIAGTTQDRPTWNLGGDIAQVYNFAAGGGNLVLGIIQPVRTTLTINRLTLVHTNRVSTDSFRLKYTPPAWFKDCTVRVYKYVGDKLNFVEDALFNIGNALGVDPNNPDGLVALGLAAIRDDIDQQFQGLQQRLDDDESTEEEGFDDVQTQLNQLSAGVYTLAEGVAQLLPPNEGESIRNTTRNRLDLDLGFL